MRGKALGSQIKRFIHRITPACAGKSYNEKGQDWYIEDHPRVCGEKFLSFLIACHRRGSPPRVRGKAWAKQKGGVGCGITPACAGKSPPADPDDNGGWDHPRVCGEKSLPPSSSKKAVGSPPRVRGKDFKQIAASIRYRITPACAGKSYHLHFQKSNTKDHPRVCGEKPSKDEIEAYIKGSPPRVRGKD